MYLEPMIEADIDYLVLGCTHYPYLIPILIDLLPKHVKIIDSGEAVARQTKTVLEQHNLLNTEMVTPKLEFYTNGNLDVMRSLLDGNFDIEYLDF
jgi:glutamate racemase